MCTVSVEKVTYIKRFFLFVFFCLTLFHVQWLLALHALYIHIHMYIPSYGAYRLLFFPLLLFVQPNLLGIFICQGIYKASSDRRHEWSKIHFAEWVWDLSGWDFRGFNIVAQIISLLTLLSLLSDSHSQRFMQYLASSNSTFNLSSFLDKGTVQGIRLQPCWTSLTSFHIKAHQRFDRLERVYKL